MVLILPCDWRFLPKLGPRALWLRGPFLTIVSRDHCHAFSRASCVFFVSFQLVTCASQHQRRPLRSAIRSHKKRVNPGGRTSNAFVT